MKPSTLADDIIDALDGELDKCELNRKALLQPYVNRTEDDLEVASVEPETRNSTKRRYPTVLGPPVNLGGAPSVDPLPALGRRLVEAGGSSASLARASRATHAFGHLLVSYEQGMCAGMSIRDWRKSVKEHFDKAETSILAAKSAVEAWVTIAPANQPNSAVLKDQVLISPEMFQELVCVGVDAARKIVSGGRYGKFVKIGRRQFLRRADFDAALDAQQVVQPTNRTKSSTSVLANLPRKSHGKGRGRRAEPHAAAGVSPPPTPPPSSEPQSASGPSWKRKKSR